MITFSDGEQYETEGHLAAKAPVIEEADVSQMPAKGRGIGAQMPGIEGDIGVKGGYLGRPSIDIPATYPRPGNTNRRTELDPDETNDVQAQGTQLNTSEVTPQIIPEITSPPYPSAEEGKFAKEVGLGYGKTWDNYMQEKVARVMSRESSFQVKGKPPALTPSAIFEETAMQRKSIPEAAKLILDPKASNVIDLTKKENSWVKENLDQAFSRAAIAVGRSGLATLGFDPSKVAVDAISGLTTLGGVYQRNLDRPSNEPAIGMNTAYDRGMNSGGPSTVVHESLHRGLEHLARRNPEAAKLMDSIPHHEEFIVRYLMATKMGDPEKTTGAMNERLLHPTQREQALKMFSKEDITKIKKLEDMAAQEVVKKHPRGPQ